MPAQALKYVKTYQDRHGTQHAYFRRRGYATVTLPLPIGSAAFWAAYAQALHASESAPPVPKGVSRTLPGSFGALVAHYYASPDFTGLAPITQRTYRGSIERFRAAFADIPAKAISAATVHECLEALTPGAAHGLRRVLRILFRRAVLIGFRTDNPMDGIARRRSKTAGFKEWEEADIAAFEAHWPSGSKPRLALALLLYTAQRRGDVVRMGRQHLRDGRIEVVQGKTGSRLAIPVHPALQAELGAHPIGLTFLLTEHGQPFSAAGFSKWFVERARRAGLAGGLSPHGLRKAAARRLAEAGCSVHEIMAVTGHKSLSEVSVYTKAADQMRLADAAMIQSRSRK